MHSHYKFPQESNTTLASQLAEIRDTIKNAGLGQGAVRDQNGRAGGAQSAEEGVEFALDAATAKAQQGAHEGRQRQLASASEGMGVIGAAGGFGEGRAVQVIRKISQNELCKITVLRQKSCQPQKKVKKIQQLTNYSGLSSVDWAQRYAEKLVGIILLSNMRRSRALHSFAFSE